MTHVLDALGRIKEYWGSVALADLDDYARGVIIRGGAVGYEAYAAETAGAVLIGDGTDIISDTTPTIAGLVTGQAGFIATGYTIAGAPAAADYMVFGMDSPDGRIFAYDPVAGAYLALLSDVDIYRLRYTSTDTDVLHHLLRLEVFTSNVAAAGLGTGIEFQIEDDGGGADVLGTIECISTDVTAGAEHGAVIVRTAHIGVDGLVERWRWAEDGAVLVAGPSMTVPDGWNLFIDDAVASAFQIVDDTTGNEYLGFKTSAQLEVVVNEDGADIDFRVEAAGIANALSVSGATGNVSMGAVPGAAPRNLFIKDTVDDVMRITLEGNAGGATVVEFGLNAGGDLFISRGGTGGEDDILVQADGDVILAMHGNVGVKTNDPQRDFHVVGPDGVVAGFPGAMGAKDLMVFENDDNANFAFVAGANMSAAIKFYEDGVAAFLGAIVYDYTNDIMQFGTNGTLPWVTLDANGHFYPDSNKGQDLGLAGNRWREIFCSLALNTGTSRLVPVQKNCAVDGTQLVRSTGGLRVLGENSDWLLAFCPTCGTVAMEELKHRMAPATKTAPKVVLVGMEVLKHSGNTRSVTVNFRYGDDVEDKLGIVQKASHNSTTLGDDELAAFLGMADDKERRAFLLNLGRIEWNALEKMEVVGMELDDEQAQIDLAIRELVGKDLSKEVANGKPN